MRQRSPTGTQPGTRPRRRASNALPSDAQVIGAVWRAVPETAIVVGAAGGLPGELHKLWRSHGPATATISNMAIPAWAMRSPAALGVKLAAPDREVVVMVGDGSYLMLNSELATSVMLGAKLIVVLLDNRGFGCINRLQQATGGERLQQPACRRRPEIDFVAHAQALGRDGRESGDPWPSSKQRWDARLASDRSYVIVIETDPELSTDAGGAWWDVAVAEVSERADVAERAQIL